MIRDKKQKRLDIQGSSVSTDPLYEAKRFLAVRIAPKIFKTFVVFSIYFFEFQTSFWLLP